MNARNVAMIVGAAVLIFAGIEIIKGVHNYATANKPRSIEETMHQLGD